jgi:hypothetical protein
MQAPLAAKSSRSVLHGGRSPLVSKARFNFSPGSKHRLLAREGTESESLALSAAGMVEMDRASALAIHRSGQLRRKNAGPRAMAGSTVPSGGLQLASSGPPFRRADDQRPPYRPGVVGRRRAASRSHCLEANSGAHHANLGGPFNKREPPTASSHGSPSRSLMVKA